MTDRDGINHSKTLTHIETSDGYPALIPLKDGRWAVSWQSYDSRHDRILLQFFEEENALELTVDGTDGYRPRAALDGNGNLWVAWAAWDSDSWCINVRSVSPGGQAGALHILDPGRERAVGYPSIACGSDNRIWVAWSELGPQSRVCYSIFQGERWSGVETIPSGGHARRPSLAALPDGSVWCFYELESGGSYHMAGCCHRAEAWLAPVSLASLENGYACEVTACAGGEHTVWAAWHEIGRDSHLVYRLASFRSGELQEHRVLGPYRHWNAHQSVVSLRSGDLAWVYCVGWQLNLRMISDGRLSDPCTLTAGRRFNRRPWLGADETGALFMVWQSAPANGHVISRRSDIFYLANWSASIYPDAEALEIERELSPFTCETYLRRHGDVLSIPAAELQPTLPELASLYQSYRVCWGDIHGHTGLSDAVGFPDHYFHAARNRAGLDFSALSDHDAFPDLLTPAEWALIQSESNAWNGLDDFATLVGFEWTSNEYQEDYGHRNVYYRGSRGDLLRCTDPDTDNADKILAAAKARCALVIPHHPSAGWSVVSAAVDWSFHDDGSERAVEVYSHHGCFEDGNQHSVYAHNVSKLANKSVRDALNLGYHMAIIAGSDSHQLEHGIVGGLTAVYADAARRESVFDGIFSRRTYATTGARIQLLFAAGDALMGEEISAPLGTSLALRVSVQGTAPILEAALWTSDGPIARYSSGSNSISFLHEYRITFAREVYVYLRVTQVDEHVAWSSPIWIKGEEA